MDSHNAKRQHSGGNDLLGARKLQPQHPGQGEDYKVDVERGGQNTSCEEHGPLVEAAAIVQAVPPDPEVRDGRALEDDAEDEANAYDHVEYEA